MSQQNGTPEKKAAFARKLAALAEKSEITDADFADAAYTAMSEFGLAEGSFRDAFGLTKGAVDRWTQGKNLPQPSIRGKIILWIMAQMK